jgi:hypothetical protein
VPMQTIQLLPDCAARIEFLRCAHAHLESGGVLAIAISEAFDLYEVPDGMAGPLPDMRELEGVVYASHPTAVREDGDGFVLERRRETITAKGARTVEYDTIHLERITAPQLEREAKTVGLTAAGRQVIPANDDYVGSTVVMLRA